MKKSNGLDLSKFKKISSDAKHTTMLHPDGHTIKISNTMISPKLRGELAAMEMHERPSKKRPVKMTQGGVVKYDMEGRPVPQEEKETKSLGERVNYPGAQASPKPVKMARGGLPTVGAPKDESEGENISITLPADRLPEIPSDLINPNPGSRAMANNPQEISPELAAVSRANELPYGVTPEAVGQMQSSAQPQAASIYGRPPQSVPPMMAQASSSPMAAASQSGMANEASKPAADGLDSAVNMQMAGINAEAKAVGDASNAKAQALKEGRAEQENNLAYLKGESEKVLRASNDAIMALKEHKIDPNRYFSNMGVGQRISTGIGLILGGLGGAAMHQENPALKMLNQQIDRDVDAQRMELGQKENLVGALARQFGNVRDATDMARIIQKETTAMRLEEAATKSGDPMAQARAQQAAGMLLREVEPQKEKIALRRTVEGLMQQAKSDPDKVQQALEAMRQIDPERAKDLESRLVPGMGFALTNDDAKTLKEMKGSTETIKTGVKRLVEIGKVSGKSFSPQLRAEAEAIATGLKGPMRTALGLGTLSEGDMKLLDGIIRNPTSVFSLDSSNKKALETLMKRTDENLSRAAEARGLKTPDPAQGLPSQQRTYVEWARKYKGDPRAKIVLDKLGIE